MAGRLTDLASGGQGSVHDGAVVTAASAAPRISAVAARGVVVEGGGMALPRALGDGGGPRWRRLGARAATVAVSPIVPLAGSGGWPAVVVDCDGLARRR